MDSSSETLYLTPLFAPGVTFHSQLSSKSPNVSTVIRSPPFRGRPSGTLGTLPLAIFLIMPSTTTQCAVGTVSYPSPRHPVSVRPSNSMRHPAARSAAVRWLGGPRLADLVLVEAVPATTAIPKTEAPIMAAAREATV